jgi:hypothetical protein
MDIVACLLAPWSSGKDPDRYNLAISSPTWESSKHLLASMQFIRDGTTSVYEFECALPVHKQDSDYGPLIV